MFQCCAVLTAERGDHLGDDGHFLAERVQTDLGRKKTVNHYSPLRFCQPEQGGDQSAFPGAGASNNADLQERDEKNSYQIKNIRVM